MFLSVETESVVWRPVRVILSLNVLRSWLFSRSSTVSVYVPLGVLLGGMSWNVFVCLAGKAAPPSVWMMYVPSEEKSVAIHPTVAAVPPSFLTVAMMGVPALTLLDCRWSVKRASGKEKYCVFLVDWPEGSVKVASSLCTPAGSDLMGTVKVWDWSVAEEKVSGLLCVKDSAGAESVSVPCSEPTKQQRGSTVTETSASLPTANALPVT